MRRLYLTCDEHLLKRIARLAEAERRDFRQQALHMLEQSVEQAELEIRLAAAIPVASNVVDGRLLNLCQSEVVVWDPSGDRVGATNGSA